MKTITIEMPSCIHEVNAKYYGEGEIILFSERGDFGSTIFFEHEDFNIYPKSIMFHDDINTENQKTELKTCLIFHEYVREIFKKFELDIITELERVNNEANILRLFVEFR